MSDAYSIDAAVVSIDLHRCQDQSTVINQLEWTTSHHHPKDLGLEIYNYNFYNLTQPFSSLCKCCQAFFLSKGSSLRLFRAVEKGLIRFSHISFILEREGWMLDSATGQTRIWLATLPLHSLFAEGGRREGGRRWGKEGREEGGRKKGGAADSVLGGVLSLTLSR